MELVNGPNGKVIFPKNRCKIIQRIDPKFSLKKNQLSDGATMDGGGRRHGCWCRRFLANKRVVGRGADLLAGTWVAGGALGTAVLRSYAFVSLLQSVIHYFFWIQ